MNNIQFEELSEKDLLRIQEIYNYYVLYSTATFHTVPLSLNEIKEMVIFINPKYKTFVLKDDHYICGYVLLTQHKKRAAYDITAEISIYLDHSYVGKGLGNLAINYIEEYAKNIGVHGLIATVTGENMVSIKLFQNNGYFKCAHYKEVGNKFDRLLDVVALQKIFD